MEKKSHNAEKTERGKRGTLWDFSISILSQTPKKLKRDPLGKNFPEKKSRNAKKIKGGTLWYRPVLCYVGNPFGSVP